MQMRRSKVRIVRMPVMRHDILRRNTLLCYQSIAVFPRFSLKLPSGVWVRDGGEHLGCDQKEIAASALCKPSGRIAVYFVEVSRFLKRSAPVFGPAGQ